jgi:hypothetical protein
VIDSDQHHDHRASRTVQPECLARLLISDGDADEQR